MLCINISAYLISGHIYIVHLHPYTRSLR